MLISRLLNCLSIECKTEDRDIKYITDNSEKVKEKTLFVCHKGAEKYIEEAIKKGAELIISAEKVNEKCIVVENTRKAYSLLCSELNENSHKKLRLIGVTGTNGKTTVASMIYHILSANGRRCGLIGTTGYLKCEGEEGAALTTPDPAEMHRLFHEMAECKTEFCVMECSSQGLFQERLHGLEFEKAIFTNLTKDHLDYHGTIENYRSSKKMLFEKAESSIINIDDENAELFKEASKKATTFSIKKDEADFTAKYIKQSGSVTDYVIVGESLIHRIKLQIPGIYNISNSMAAIICCYELGLSLDEIAAAMRNFYGVKGRFEILPLNKDYKVIIDYAHTPDSLKQILLNLSSFKKNRVITVFGCGGNRDKSKRPEMGEVACNYSDVVIITSDNPRDEEPKSIIEDILKGTDNSKTPVYIIENRTKAIEYALKKAKKNDIILLAGKGHETYQIIGDEKLFYDERKIVASLI